nr:hypothetical protein [Tanacetum cinerariifolium]
VRLIEDCQLGIMGLANMTWEGTRAHEVGEGSVTVRSVGAGDGFRVLAQMVLVV